MILEQLFGAFRKAAFQLVLVLRAQSQQYWFVVLLGLFVALVAEAAIERVGAFAGSPAERELRLLLGDPHEPDEIHLVVFLQSAANELELPIRPARDVEHAVRPAAAIDRGQAAIVDERRFG